MADSIDHDRCVSRKTYRRMLNEAASWEATAEERGTEIRLLEERLSDPYAFPTCHCGNQLSVTDLRAGFCHMCRRTVTVQIGER